MSELIKSMSFREKSLWVQVGIMIYLWIWYFGRVGIWLFDGSIDREETLGMFFAMTIILVVLSVVSHIILSIVSPKDAESPVDERDRQFADRAGNYASFMLGGGVVMISIYSVMNSVSAITMVHALVLLLITVDIVTNGLQIMYYRRGH